MLQALRIPIIENKLLQAINASMDGVALLDKDGVYYYLNDVHIRMFGYDKEEELLGKTWQYIYEDAEIERINQDIFPVMVKNGFWRGVTTGKSKSGTPIPQEITLSFTSDGGIICICRDISDRLESQLTLEMAVKAANGGLWDWDIQEGKVHFSASWLNLLGYTNDDISPDLSGFLSIMHEDDKEQVNQRIQESLQSDHIPYEAEFRLRHRNGHYLWLLDRGIVARRDANGQAVRMLGMIIDVSKFKEAQEKVAVWEKRYRKTLEVTEAAVWDWDLEKDAMNVTPRFIQLFGFTENVPEKFSYQVLAPWVHPDDIVKMDKVFSDNMQGVTGKMEVEYRQKRPDTGEYEWFYLVGSVTERKADGTPTKALGYCTSIQQRKEAELQLARAKEMAEASVKAKRRFLANISHELRTPLHAILGIGDQMQQTRLDTQQAFFLNMMNESGKGLLTIINDLLDYSKIEEGKLTLEEVPFQLSELIHSVFSLFETQTYRKGLQFRISEMDLELTAYYKGDPIRIRQVLINIIGNAIKFTEEGSIELRFWLTRQPSGDPLLHFTCVDTGIGMSEEMKTRLFEEFVQEDDSYQRKYGGSGLGLSLTRELLELMNGRIDIRSAKNKGTEVVLEIPIKASVQQALQKEQTRQGAGDQGKEDLSLMNVLVVEDNTVNRILVEIILKKYKVRFKMAVNGKEALDLVDTDDFDLVLMDIQMPVMDGLEAVEILRNERQYEKPILAMTANAVNEELSNYLQRGFTGHITKPFDEQKLYQTLKKYQP